MFSFFFLRGVLCLPKCKWLDFFHSHLFLPVNLSRVFTSHQYSGDSLISNSSLNLTLRSTFTYSRIFVISIVNPNTAYAKQNLLPTFCPSQQTANTRKPLFVYRDPLSQRICQVSIQVVKSKIPGIISTTPSFIPYGQSFNRSCHFYL